MREITQRVLENKDTTVVADCATAHEFSTRAFANVGLKPLGLVLGKCSIPIGAGNSLKRESAWVMARSLKIRASKPCKKSFVPQEVLPLVQAVYENHGVEREIIVVDETPQPYSEGRERTPSELHVKLDEKSLSLEVLVSHAGFDLPVRIQQLHEEHDASLPDAQKIESVVVHLPMTSLHVGEAYASLKRLGYFAALAWPGFW